MRAARHRLSQFFHYLGNRALTPDEQAEVQARLGPQLAALFALMTPGEQAHSLRVLRAMAAQANGQALPAGVVQAALLHDVGKTRAPVGLLGRVAVVLAGKLLPAQSARWGQGAPHGWRRPFVTAAQHAAWGADLCAEAGADPLAVALVRRHQEKVSRQSAVGSRQTEMVGEAEWLRRLQRADDE